MEDLKSEVSSIIATQHCISLERKSNIIAVSFSDTVPFSYSFAYMMLCISMVFGVKRRLSVHPSHLSVTI